MSYYQCPPSLSLDPVSATFIDSRRRETEAEAPGPAGMDLMPKSPGISKNQNLKDQVLQDVFNRKIRDLKRMQMHKSNDNKELFD